MKFVQNTCSFPGFLYNENRKKEMEENGMLAEGDIGKLSVQGTRFPGVLCR